MSNFSDMLMDHNAHALDVNITVSQWAEKRRKIKPPGWKTFELFDFRKTPYLKWPCDLMSKNSSTRKVTITKGTRNGATQGFIMNSIFYNIDVNPVKMMYVSADQSLLDKFTKVELRPQLQESGLDKFIRSGSTNKSNKNRSSGEQGDLWEFGIDGYLAMYGANNPNNFRQLGAQYVYKDERATYPNIKNEGDVSKLIDGRTNDYGPYAKIATVSTPTLAGSEYHREYQAGTEHQWQVPCPHCGFYQYLSFGEIEKDSKGRKTLLYGLDFEYEDFQLRSDVKYKCVACKISFPFDELYGINNHGKYEETKSIYNLENVSLDINSLYSIFCGWDVIANVFLEAKRAGTPTALQSFHNLYLGKFFELKKKSINIQGLLERSSGYSRSQVPEGEVGFLTCAVDIQGNRVEMEFKGWGKNYHNYSIEYLTLHGDTKKDDVWNQLERVIFKQTYGGIAPVIFTIDEGDGNMYDVVRAFVEKMNRRDEAEYFEKTGRKHIRHRVMSLKGQSAKQIRNLPIRVKELSKYNKCLFVNTYVFKERYVSWMGKEIDKETGEVPYGYPLFPEDYPRSYYKQLNSEELIIDIETSGYQKKSWRKKAGHNRNEAFDLCVYNTAAAEYFYTHVIKEIEVATGIKSWDELIESYLASNAKK